MKIREKYAKFKLTVMQYKNQLFGNLLTEKGMRYYQYLTKILMNEEFQPVSYEEIMFEEVLESTKARWVKHDRELSRHDKALIIACHLAPYYPPKKFWEDPDLLKVVGT